MYKNLEEALLDLERNGELIRIKSEVDPNLEMAEIHRRIFDAQGPAILYENVKGSPFRAASNIYGTYERTEFLFRKTLPKLKKLIDIKRDPMAAIKRPLHYTPTLSTAFHALPLKKTNGKVTYGKTSISKLPQLVSWPMDGGGFVTLPQVCTLPPGSRSSMDTNIGMYRIQMTGNDYVTDKEIGLHYQLHRGIGNHHTQYNQCNQAFKASIFVGGPPSHAFAAIMPLPEGLSEMTFAGMLGGRRFRYHFDKHGHIISNDADFVITGTIRPHETKREGPFGDHLGYYSLEHPFPVMDVDNVYHRKNAIWHFTVVGRPPAEDSSFGYLIHRIVDELTPDEFPGLKELHAVDAAGVHPLLLAIGKERYMPFRERVPEEILTIANRILGSGQTSLAKYLFIASDDDNPNLSTHNISEFFQHLLSRVDWKRDVHFHTKTTIDTLDYSGSGWNAGSKVVIACRGDKRRDLATELPSNLHLSSDARSCKLALPGVLCIELAPYQDADKAALEIDILKKSLMSQDLTELPLIILVDDAAFTAQTVNNFVWTTFTRSNPANDIYGIEEFTENKHWGCHGSLIIDARKKPHHAPELIPDPQTVSNVDKLFSKGGELYGVLKKNI